MSTAEVRKNIRNQVEIVDALQQRMSEECYHKCVTHKREAEVHVGEMACIDRCVSKYLETHDLVGKKIEEMKKKIAAIPKTEY